MKFNSLTFNLLYFIFSIFSFCCYSSLLCYGSLLSKDISLHFIFYNVFFLRMDIFISLKNVPSAKYDVSAGKIWHKIPLKGFLFSLCFSLATDFLSFFQLPSFHFIHPSIHSFIHSAISCVIHYVKLFQRQSDRQTDG